jgi:hypothetical protein
MDRATIAEDRRLMFSLMLLTFVTGLVDAASVLGLGRVFTANMTGNVVFLGFALGGAQDVSIAASLVALASFLVGAAHHHQLGIVEVVGGVPRLARVEHLDGDVVVVQQPAQDVDLVDDRVRDGHVGGVAVAHRPVPVGAVHHERVSDLAPGHDLAQREPEAAPAEPRDSRSDALSVPALAVAPRGRLRG